MTVPVNLTPEFSPGRARIFLETEIQVHDYDVFPGAERFILFGRHTRGDHVGASVSRGTAEGRVFSAQQPDIHVVLNWFEELKSLVPAP